jgi:hypothetical protein
MSETPANPFSPERRLDLFVLSMSMARNDLRYGIRLVGKANNDDAPEFGYLLRVMLGHLYDAMYALKVWRQESEDVRALLRRLPEPGREALKTAMGTEQRIGNRALEHNRVSTFHYPCPDRAYGAASSEAALAEAVRDVADMPASITARADGKDFRLVFADDVAMELAMQRFDRSAHVERFREQHEAAASGATSFVNFVDSLLALYMRERNLGLDASDAS